MDSGFRRNGAWTRAALLAGALGAAWAAVAAQELPEAYRAAGAAAALPACSDQLWMRLAAEKYIGAEPVADLEAIFRAAGVPEHRLPGLNQVAEGIREEAVAAHARARGTRWTLVRKRAERPSAAASAVSGINEDIRGLELRLKAEDDRSTALVRSLAEGFQLTLGEDSGRARNVANVLNVSKDGHGCW